MELLKMVGERREVEIPEEERGKSMMVQISDRTLQFGRAFGFLPFFTQRDSIRAHPRISRLAISSNTKKYYFPSSRYFAAKAAYEGASK